MRALAITEHRVAGAGAPGQKSKLAGKNKNAGKFKPRNNKHGGGISD